MKNRIAIIGAGSVGTNISIFLAKIGIEVLLFESRPDLLLGAPMVSFINHGDGFEYYKEGHQTTGKHCIDGSMVKGLIYPLKYFRTKVTSKNSPIRFLVSNDAVKHRLTPLNRFYKNARIMQQHFSYQYDSVVKSRSCSNMEAEKIFLRTPEQFYRVLMPDDYSDLNNISGGCAGSSFGINMAHYFAYLKAAIRKCKVEFIPNTVIRSIEKQGENYVVNTDSDSFQVFGVLVCTSHQIPNFERLIKNFALSNKSSGTYYLNSMTFINLPATSDNKKIDYLNKINFTLQGEFGAMYSCIVPPSETENGIAAIYSPSIKGSHIFSNTYNKKYPITNPIEWEALINKGIENDSDLVRYTFQKACIFYPYLINYANIVKTSVRPVFNLSVPDSFIGSDRRVRELPNRPIMNSADGRVSMWASPKWTNSELVALIALDYMLMLLGLPRIPKSNKNGFGPTKLDVGKFSLGFNLFDLKMEITDAIFYAKKQGVPERIVDTNLEAFKCIPSKSPGKPLIKT